MGLAFRHPRQPTACIPDRTRTGCPYPHYRLDTLPGLWAVVVNLRMEATRKSELLRIFGLHETDHIGVVIRPPQIINEHRGPGVRIILDIAGPMAMADPDGIADHVYKYLSLPGRQGIYTPSEETRCKALGIISKFQEQMDFNSDRQAGQNSLPVSFS